MATQVAPEVDILRREIQDKYTEVASSPELEFHFHHGLPLARILEYQEEHLAGLPAEAVESFAGVGNPFSVGQIAVGETVLDIGSGCGFDCFIAAKMVGPTGKVIGVDMTDAMLEKSQKTAKEMWLTQLEFKKGYAEELPAPDNSVDVVISNGVINLTPDKYAIFREAFRVLKPGGRLYLADIVVYKFISDEIRKEVDLWTAWIGGALLEGEYLDAISSSGLIDVELISTKDVFDGAEGGERAKQFETMGANIRAQKP